MTRFRAALTLALLATGCSSTIAPGTSWDGGAPADAPAAPDGPELDADAGRPDRGPPVRGFGDPCAGNFECLSGLCVDGPTGAYCTTDCADGCPDGWECKPVTGGGLPATAVCLPARNTLCEPCAADAQCNVTGDLCVAIGYGTFCGRDCSLAACPPGYACSDVPLTGSTARQCLPAGGSCDCTTAGQTKGCTAQNAFGACTGTAICDPAVGWSACDARVPAAETCNGLDDDCDGFVDDGDRDVVYPNADPADPSCAFGAAACVGRYRCEDAGGGAYDWICDPGPPTAEVCDGRDNDCNGETDEPFARDVGGTLVYDRTTASCGGCGNDCAALLPHAASFECATEGATVFCRALSCQPSYYVDGTMCRRLIGTLCRPCAADADCGLPGSRCVPLADGAACGQDCAPGSVFDGQPLACTGAVGTRDCCPAGYLCTPVAGGAPQCVPQAGSCACGPTTDGLARHCTVVDPTDAGHTCPGVEVCDAASASFGACGNAALNLELCNYEDDDCNGQSDEPFIDQHGSGTYDTDEHCGSCENDCVAAWDPVIQHARGHCDATSSPPACVMTCEPGYTDVNASAVDGCECQRTSDTDLPDTDFGGYPSSGAFYVDADCDGIDGTIGDALFVSASASGLQDGTIDHPYRTIAQAVSAFGASGKQYILVSEGVYTEQVVMQDGIRLHGGYSLGFRARNIVLYPSIIKAPEPSYAPGYHRGAVSVECGSWTKETIVSGFTIYGYDVDTAAPAATAGYNTYGVYLKDCGPGVLVANNYVVGGRGGNGAAGVVGARGFGATDSGGTALNGVAGLNGTAWDGQASDCSGAGVKIAGGAGGAMPGTHPECRNWGVAGGSAHCPRYCNSPDFFDPANPGTHWGLQGEFRECRDGHPEDCCPPDYNYGPTPCRTPQPPPCTNPPFACMLPQGAATGLCVPKRTCTSDADCPIQYTCQGSGPSYCEVPASCGSDDECPSGFDCVGSACRPSLLGLPGAGAYASSWNVVRHDCQQICEPGCPLGPIGLIHGLDGNRGGVGHSGVGGTGCAGRYGALDGDEWGGVVAAAAAAGRGQPGQPGGGGGVSSGVTWHQTGSGSDCKNYSIAASGGGGGAGGCGGGGGAGAQRGGGSFGIFVFFSATPAAGQLPQVASNYVRRNFGGAGGRGGDGGDGGAGGFGGGGAILESTGDMFATYTSGHGGQGGTGGPGGGGGGGCGGVSHGIGVVNTPDASYEYLNTYYAEEAPVDTGGPPGAGGASIDPAKLGTPGQKGPFADFVAYCGPGGLCPAGLTCQDPVCL